VWLLPSVLKVASTNESEGADGDGDGVDGVGEGVGDCTDGVGNGVGRSEPWCDGWTDTTVQTTATAITTKPMPAKRTSRLFVGTRPSSQGPDLGYLPLRG
jgi:hypothetical protein